MVLDWEINQFMSKKIPRFGAHFLFYETGFLLDLVVFTGKQTTIELIAKIDIFGQL